MKANRNDRENFVLNKDGFTFIVPLTIALIVGFSLLAIGSYAVGTIGSALEDSYPTNVKSGSLDTTYSHLDNVTQYRNITLPAYTDVSDLDSTLTNFYIFANGTHNIYYNLSMNGNSVNDSSLLLASTGYNVTLASMIAGDDITNDDTYLNYSWDTNSSENQVVIRYVGTYFTSDDLRSTNENKTVVLIGDVVDGFSDVVDVEVVVIIITVLSMAIITIMAVGSRRNLF